MKLNVKLTADELMNVVDAAVDAARERDYDMIPEEELIKDMTYIVDVALSAMGIEIVPADEDEDEETDDFGLPMDYWSEFDEDEEEGEEEEEEEKKPERVYLDFDKPISQCVFIYEGQRAIKQSDVNQILQAIMKTIENRLGFLPEEIKRQMCTDVLLQILEDNDVEIMVKGE